MIKSLRSPFALVLSGTPLENRLDELYSVVQFIDDRRLAPAFRFFNRHRVVDEQGKVLGYRNLAALRATLRPVLLRRTREAVMQQLPPRTTEVVRIPPTDEQSRRSGASSEGITPRPRARRQVLVRSMRHPLWHHVLRRRLSRLPRRGLLC